MNLGRSIFFNLAVNYYKRVYMLLNIRLPTKINRKREGERENEVGGGGGGGEILAYSLT